MTSFWRTTTTVYQWIKRDPSHAIATMLLQLMVGGMWYNYAMGHNHHKCFVVVVEDIGLSDG